MNRKEAIEFIIKTVPEIRKPLDDKVNELKDAIESGDIDNVKLDVRTFTSIMFDIIRYRWTRQSPGTFLTCYVTGDEYYKTPKAAYSHYMKVINGNLNEFVTLNELDDYHIHQMGYTSENRLKMFKRRLSFIDELLNNTQIDIIQWCVDNVCI